MAAVERFVVGQVGVKFGTAELAETRAGCPQSTKLVGFFEIVRLERMRIIGDLDIGPQTTEDAVIQSPNQRQPPVFVRLVPRCIPPQGVGGSSIVPWGGAPVRIVCFLRRRRG